MDQKPQDGQRLEIMIDDDVAMGIYANLAVVNHSSDEFTLDFVYVPPNSNKAKLRSRIISSPHHTKRLLMALQENVRRYEERFGTIELNPSPADSIRGEMGHA